MAVDSKQIKSEPYKAVEDIAKKVVCEGIVMLKNNGVSPQPP